MKSERYDNVGPESPDPFNAVIIFTIFVLLLVYVLGAYPLLLTLLRGRGLPRPADPPQWPLVTVVMPVRNGEKWLAAKLQSLLALDYDHDKLHIVVISDGSTDGTDAIAASFGPPVEVVRVPGGGKAAGLNAGIENARGDVLFFTDVRQPLAPDSLKQSHPPSFRPSAWRSDG